jgi:histidyl-tRNA synthetase
LRLPLTSQKLPYLDDESLNHFKQVKNMLEMLEVTYEVDENMVRGLDYYNDTIFEIMTEDPNFGSNATICAGGRYDHLVEEVGGPETPGFGFAIGLERLVLLLDDSNYNFPVQNELEAFIVTIGDEVNNEALKLAIALRNHGLTVEREFVGRKPGSQFKTADKLNAKTVFTLGGNELKNRVVNVKLLETGQETAMELDDIYSDEFPEIYKKTLEKLTSEA